MDLKYFNLTGRILATAPPSSEEPLPPAGGRSLGVLDARRRAEDRPRRLHREDEVEVGDHHDEARQEGEAEPEAPHAAAERRRHPVNQPADTKQTHPHVKV